MNANVLGRNRGIKFGMPAIKQIISKIPNDDQKKGMSSEDLDFAQSMLMYEMVYWGLRNNCYNKKEEPDFTMDEVREWVDSNISKNPEFFVNLTECFSSATLIASERENLAAEGEKKSTSTSRRKKAGTD